MSEKDEKKSMADNNDEIMDIHPDIADLDDTS